MRVTIVGGGIVGSHLIEEFSKKNAEIVLIESQQERVEEIKKAYDILAIKGDGLSHYILRSINVATSDLFVASTHSDSVNIVACQLAKRLGARYTVSRLVSDEIFPDNVAELESHLGIDWMVSPNQLAAWSLVSSLQSNVTGALENYFSGKLSVAKVPLNKNSKWRGKTIQAIRVPKLIRPLGFTRQRVYQDMKSPHRLEEHDNIFLTGDRAQLVKMLVEHGRNKEKTKRHKIFIAGAGRVIKNALSYMPELANKITLFEKDKKLCEEIHSAYEVTVLQLDPSNLDLLRQENPNLCHSFICGSEEDSENLVYALNAQELGIPHIIPIIRKSENLPLFKRFQFSQVISLNHIFVNELDRYFNPNLAEDFSFFPETTIRAINKQIDQKSKFLDNPIISVMDQYPNLELVAIWRERTVLAFSLESHFRLNDRVLVMAADGQSSVLQDFLKA